MLLIFSISTAVSIPGNTLPITAMMVLNGTNYQIWKKTLMLNLTIMKLDLALKIDPPEKPTAETTAEAKQLYENWEYSNNSCMMLLEYYVEDCIF